MTDWSGVHLYTIGHSTRSFEELLEMLQAFTIRTLADIRTVPRSARHPQFNSDALSEALPRHQLQYLPIAELGGLRRANKDSVNGAWENASFRGYADHMLSEEFELGLQKLLDLCHARTTVIMCAEAVPWRCHRTLVADAVTARGGQVEHIMSASKANPHRITKFARIEGDHVWYPG